VGHGENIGGIMTKRIKAETLKIDWKGTKRIRSAMAKQESVKVTIHLDANGLAALKETSEKSGAPYKRLLNSILEESLKNREVTESRLEKLEKELKKVKQKIAA
jgi:predicted DNA binding CopG/RHH family protein